MNVLNYNFAYFFMKEGLKTPNKVQNDLGFSTLQLCTSHNLSVQFWAFFCIFFYFSIWIFPSNMFQICLGISLCSELCRFYYQKNHQPIRFHQQYAHFKNENQNKKLTIFLSKILFSKNMLKIPNRKILPIKRYHFISWDHFTL